MTSSLSVEPCTLLFVDDEPLACKWFARSFGQEFTVLTAGSVNQALDVLGSHADKVSLLLTDFRMPGRSGLELLRVVQRDYPHVVRMLISAHAEKEVVIAAVNEGQVFRILEKPLDEQPTRMALREASDLYRLRAGERAQQENRSAAMRETLGFVAHELTTPLSIVRGYMEALKSRLQPVESEICSGTVTISESRPGQVAAALDAAERSALHCQSLMSTFVQSARDAYPGAPPQSFTASSLVGALLDQYPFEHDERASVSSRVERDFTLPGRRDLLYLVLCTLAKNALRALRGRPEGTLAVIVSCDLTQDCQRQWIKFEDNGPGIEPELLARLMKTPVTTNSGGSGMGLVFCRRVVQSLEGTIAISSELGRGTAVTLYFPPFNEGNPEGVVV